MKVLSLMLVLVVALAALMGSARAMPDPYALADADPAADPHFRRRFGYGGFGGFGGYGGFGGFGGGFYPYGGYGGGFWG